MKGIKFLLGLGFLSLLTTSVFAQDIEPLESKLTTVCHQTKNSKYNSCETTHNGKVVRKILYHNHSGKIVMASTYYTSGRVSKHIMFDKGVLEGILIYPNEDQDSPKYATYQQYHFTFKNGKFLKMSNMAMSYFWVYKDCKEDTPNGTKCNELNYFYPSSEPDLHPALALPIENQGLGVLKSNGIKMP